MTIKHFCNRMNDHGTKPRVCIFDHSTLDPTIVYDGSPYDVPAEIGKMTVNSFTVCKMGFVTIHIRTR